jgi:hypothetical protein
VLTHEKLYVHDNPEISSQTFRYGDWFTLMFVNGEP